MQRKCYYITLNSGRTSLNLILNNIVREQIGVAPISAKMRAKHLQWFVYAKRAVLGTMRDTAYSQQIALNLPKEPSQNKINATLILQQIDK